MSKYPRMGRRLQKIGIATRRFGYANNQLTEDEVREAGIERSNACRDFANKYGMPYNDAVEIGITISDCVDLGLSY